MKKEKIQAVRTLFRSYSTMAIHGRTIDSCVLEAAKVVNALGVSNEQIADIMGEGSNIIRIIRQNESPETEIEFPADVLAHWATGPVPACHAHAAGLQSLGGVLGASVPVTPLTEPAECANCRNEAKGRTDGE